VEAVFVEALAGAEQKISREGAKTPRRTRIMEEELGY
jgi:hypothetical protein